VRSFFDQLLNNPDFLEEDIDILAFRLAVFFRRIHIAPRVFHLFPWGSRVLLRDKFPCNKASGKAVGADFNAVARAYFIL